MKPYRVFNPRNPVRPDGIRHGSHDPSRKAEKKAIRRAGKASAREE